MWWIAGGIAGLGLLGLVAAVFAALGALRRLAAVLRTLQLRTKDVVVLEPGLAELRERAERLQAPLEMAAQRAAALGAGSGRSSG
jgi:hypothetical protein